MPVRQSVSPGLSPKFTFPFLARAALLQLGRPGRGNSGDSDDDGTVALFLTLLEQAMMPSRPAAAAAAAAAAPFIENER